MSELEAEMLIRKANRILERANLVDLFRPNYSFKKAIKNLYKAAEIYYHLCEYTRAGNIFEQIGGKVFRVLSDTRSAIKYYDYAANCFAVSNIKYMCKHMYLKAFRLYLNMGDFSGAENYSDEASEYLEAIIVDSSCVSEFYENVINIYVEKATNYLANRFTNKYEFKHAEYQFRVEKYDEASQLFQGIIAKSTESSCDKRITESSCVYTCLMAILTQEQDIQRQIDDIYPLWSDFEQFTQNLVVKRITESFQNKDLRTIEEAVYFNVTADKEFVNKPTKCFIVY